MTVIGTYVIGPGTYTNYRIRVPYGDIILTGNITFNGGDTVISSQNGNISTINANITLVAGTNGLNGTGIPDPVTNTYSKRTLTLSVGNGTIDVGNINATGSHVFLYSNRALGNLYGIYTSSRSSTFSPAVSADYLLSYGFGRLLTSTVESNTIVYNPTGTSPYIAINTPSGMTFRGTSSVTGNVIYRTTASGITYEQVHLTNSSFERIIIANSTVNGYNSSVNFNTLNQYPTVSISAVNSVFGLGTNLSAYRGVTWYEGTALSGTFPSTNLRLRNFLGKRGVYGSP
jgi:hypothetical protein